MSTQTLLAVCLCLLVGIAAGLILYRHTNILR
jgi:uncharacterized protein YneF (UPF0154 family)